MAQSGQIGGCEPYTRWFHVFCFSQGLSVLALSALRNQSVSSTTLVPDVTFISINDSCVSKN